MIVGHKSSAAASPAVNLVECKAIIFHMLCTVEDNVLKLMSRFKSFWNINGERNSIIPSSSQHSPERLFYLKNVL